MNTPMKRFCPKPSCAPSYVQVPTVLHWKPSDDEGTTGVYLCPKCKHCFTPEYFAEIEEPKPCCPTLAYRLLTWEQFRAEMLAAIVKHNERLTKEQLCEDLMDVEKPALSAGNLSAFLEAMRFGYAPIAPCFIQSSDLSMVYFFTGTESILFTLPKQ